MSPSFVSKLHNHYRRTGSVEPDKQGGDHRSHRIEAHGDWILDGVAAVPDMTLAEVRSGLADHGLSVSFSTVWRFFERHGMSLKKKTAHAAEQERDDVAAARARWKDGQATLDPDRLVFVDETGAATNMARRYGRSRRGQRLVAAVPHGHWKTTTFVAALRQDRIDAPMVIDQTMNGTIVKAWVEQCLAPTLSPGDIVIMDNLPAHKVKGVRDAIEAKKSRPRLPAAILTRLQPHRAGLRQAQGHAQKGRRAIHRRPLAKDRLVPRSLPARRMRKLLP